MVVKINTVINVVNKYISDGQSVPSMCSEQNVHRLYIFNFIHLTTVLLLLKLKYRWSSIFTSNLNTIAVIFFSQGNNFNLHAK